MNKFSIFFIITAFCIVARSETLSSGENQTLQYDTNTKMDSLKIPAYELYPVVNNCVFSQTVIYSLRFTAIGITIGTTMGEIIDLCIYNDQRGFFIPVGTIVSSFSGSGIGLITGLITGINKGIKLNRNKKNNPGIHPYRCRFGYEYKFLDFGLLSNDPSIKRNYPFDNAPSFALAYRTLVDKKLVPSKISLGYNNTMWGKVSNYYVGSYGDLYLHSIEAITHYNFIENHLAIPYWAFGIGYSWGKEVTSIGFEGKEYRISSPVFRGYLGCELNLFDFLFVDIKIGYEPIGPYLSAHNKKYFPYGQNFLFILSVGTYIF
jgi:hypothetical protein